MTRLDQIRFILVQPSHPGNVGAAARAMKNMGLMDLGLVAPALFPHPDATARAAGADDVLRQAGRFQTLAEALADSVFTVATTARARSLAWPATNPREAAALIFDRAATGRVAVVFGAERCGLSNDELALCHVAVVIPTNPDFSSLNLAAAVQIMAYELRNQMGEASPAEIHNESDDPWVNHAQMEGLYDHVDRMLRHIGFFDSGNPEVVMRRLRRMFARTQLTERELNILRGTCKAVLAMRR